MTENQMASALLVTLSSPRSPISEAYRTLRTNLQFVCLDKPLRSLLATSAGPEEGKSTMLANLAVAMAQGEKKVILVDCDLRRPNLHQLFGLGHKRGLTTMMVEEQAMTHLCRIQVSLACSCWPVARFHPVHPTCWGRGGWTACLISLRSGRTSCSWIRRRLWR
jgi:Mrp family chromosome partitioning ATPase